MAEIEKIVAEISLLKEFKDKYLYARANILALLSSRGVPVNESDNTHEFVKDLMAYEFERGRLAGLMEQAQKDQAALAQPMPQAPNPPGAWERAVWGQYDKFGGSPRPWGVYDAKEITKETVELAFNAGAQKASARKDAEQAAIGIPLAPMTAREAFDLAADVEMEYKAAFVGGIVAAEKHHGISN